MIYGLVFDALPPDEFLKSAGKLLGAIGVESDVNINFNGRKNANSILDRALTKVVPGEKAKLRLDFVDCLNREIGNLKKRQFASAGVAFDWSEASSSSVYYDNMLQILRGTFEALERNDFFLHLPMRLPDREVECGFFRRVLGDLCNRRIQICVEHYVHDALSKEFDWETKLKGMIFDLRKIVIIYEPLLGNKLSRTAMEKGIKFLDCYKLDLEVFFYPVKLTELEKYDDELNHLRELVNAEIGG